MLLQGLYHRSLFIVSKCWIFARHIHPMGNLGSNWKRGCYLEVLSWTSSLIPIRRALCPRNSWTFSFILPYLSEMMFVDISLDCVVSQRPLCGTLFRIPCTPTLMFPYSRRMMIVLRRPLHSVVSDRNVLGIFIPLPPAVLIGFTHEANIAFEAGLAKFCFSVLWWSCFTQVNKAPWFLFHVL